MSSETQRLFLSHYCISHCTTSIVILSNEPYQGGIVHKFDCGIAGMDETTVMSVDGVQEGVQHAALWGASAELRGDSKSLSTRESD